MEMASHLNRTSTQSLSSLSQSATQKWDQWTSSGHSFAAREHRNADLARDALGRFLGDLRPWTHWCTLTFSDKAEMDAKPELEIYADDVRCSHGATAGQLDETALFYLRSRGIPEAKARNILIQSFVAGALNEVKVDVVREAMMNKVIHWLPAQCFLAEEWTKE